MKTVFTASNFVGKPFSDQEMAADTSFKQQIMTMEADPNWQQVVKATGQENQRAALLVFGLDNFMFWYGLNDIPKQEQFLTYRLPQAQVASLTIPGKLPTLMGPLKLLLPTFLSKLGQEKIPIYENLGDSPTPYILLQADLEKETITESLYLKHV